MRLSQRPHSLLVLFHPPTVVFLLALSLCTEFFVALFSLLQRSSLILVVSPILFQTNSKDRWPPPRASQNPFENLRPPYPPLSLFLQCFPTYNLARERSHVELCKGASKKPVGTDSGTLASLPQAPDANWCYRAILSNTRIHQNFKLRSYSFLYLMYFIISTESTVFVTLTDL